MDACRKRPLATPHAGPAYARRVHIAMPSPTGTMLNETRSSRSRNAFSSRSASVFLSVCRQARQAQQRQQQTGWQHRGGVATAQAAGASAGHMRRRRPPTNAPARGLRRGHTCQGREAGTGRWSSCARSGAGGLHTVQCLLALPTPLTQHRPCTKHTHTALTALTTAHCPARSRPQAAPAAAAARSSRGIPAAGATYGGHMKVAQYCTRLTFEA